MHSRTRNQHCAAVLLVMLSAACGGDDAKHGDSPPFDASSGTDASINRSMDAALDAAQLDASATPDAVVDGSPGDASVDALAAALDPSGVHIDSARSMLVFSAYCSRYTECTSGSGPGDVEACLQSAGPSYQALVDSGASDACLDATLDLYGCAVTLSCTAFFDGCPEATTAFMAACPTQSMP